VLVAGVISAMADNRLVLVMYLAMSSKAMRDLKIISSSNLSEFKLEVHANSPSKSGLGCLLTGGKGENGRIVVVGIGLN
jgi:hypothetical protein